MLDIGKALTYLRAELARVNRVIDVYESLAEERYQERRQKAAPKAKAKPKASDKQLHEEPFSPPQKLDPDITLWLQ